MADMKFLLVCVAACLALSACVGSRESRITGVADLPLKTTAVPGMAWQDAPLRANSRYLLYNARSARQKVARLGDYYHVRWYDAEPEKPVRLVMHYTQAATTSQILLREISIDAPRASRGERKSEFFFAGEERALRGDILSWRIDLYVDGKLKDSRKSYLWD